MRQTLIVHPTTPCGPVSEIVVEVARSDGLLTLDYIVTGNLSQLALPDRVPSVRLDRLWEHSCFEAFIGTPDNYLELNFAPSTAWAAYRFEGQPIAGQRLPRRDAGIGPPEIRIAKAPAHFELHAEVRILRWEGRLGLSAVIEERSGRKSYWALFHPQGPPNFHHPACFAADLPPAPSP